MIVNIFFYCLMSDKTKTIRNSMYLFSCVYFKRSLYVKVDYPNYKCTVWRFISQIIIHILHGFETEYILVPGTGMLHRW